MNQEDKYKETSEELLQEQKEAFKNAAEISFEFEKYCDTILNNQEEKEEDNNFTR